MSLSTRFFAQRNSGGLDGDEWVQLDLSVGKRFLDNQVALEVGVENLLDQEFNFNPLITLNEEARRRRFFIEARINF